MADKGILMIKAEDIQGLTEQIARNFQPEKVILFGSHAHGRPREDSDVDLLVLLPFKGSGFRKALDMLNQLNPQFAVDLIVKRPEDALRRYRQGDPLLREAMDRGKVLYERRH